jgi:hypothetical protein
MLVDALLALANLIVLLGIATLAPDQQSENRPCRAMITDSQRIVARSCWLVMPTARVTPSLRVRSKIDSCSPAGRSCWP